MIVFRIDRLKREKSVLSGKGAEQLGGRWNPVGTPVVYCAENRALAMLEILVHALHKRFLPPDRILVSIEVPEQLIVKIFKPKDLPRYWRSNNSTLALQNFMLPHIEKYPVIKVPSVIMPDEFNIMLNPNHADFHMIRVIEIKPLEFDNRLKPEN